MGICASTSNVESQGGSAESSHLAKSKSKSREIQQEGNVATSKNDSSIKDEMKKAEHFVGGTKNIADDDGDVNRDGSKVGHQRATKRPQAELDSQVETDQTVIEENVECQEAIKDEGKRKQLATACVDENAFTRMKLLLLTHHANKIEHGAQTPLIVAFGAPPSVDALATLKKAVENDFDLDQCEGSTSEAGRTKNSFLNCPGAIVDVDPRPLANKIRLVCKFPEAGTYELSVFCKQEDRVCSAGVSVDEDKSHGALVMQYQVIVSKETEAMQNGALKRFAPMGRLKSAVKKTLSRTGSFGSQVRTTSLSSSDLWRGPVISPLTKQSKIAVVASEALLHSVSIRNRPTNLLEDTKDSGDDGKNDALNPMLKISSTAGVIGRLKRRASVAKENLKARQQIEPSMYAGQAPVMSEVFAQCNLSLRSHPELLIVYGGTESKYIEKRAALVQRGDSLSHGADNIIDSKAMETNAPCSANGPLTVTLGVPPNVDSLAILQRWSMDGKSLTRVKNNLGSDAGPKRGILLDPRPKSHKLRLVMWFDKPGMYELDVYCITAQRAKGQIGEKRTEQALTYMIDVREATTSHSSTQGIGKQGGRASKLKRRSISFTLDSADAAQSGKDRKRKVASGQKPLSRTDSFQFRAW